MKAPRILFIGRRDIQEHESELKRFVELVPVGMAICQSDEDATEAKKLTPVVATFTELRAIVADFPGSIIVYDDGSVGPLELVEEAVPEAPLVKISE